MGHRAVAHQTSRHAQPRADDVILLQQLLGHVRHSELRALNGNRHAAHELGVLWDEIGLVMARLSPAASERATAR